jgi:hypothetical protein
LEDNSSTIEESKSNGQPRFAEFISLDSEAFPLLEQENFQQEGTVIVEVSQVSPRANSMVINLDHAGASQEILRAQTSWSSEVEPKDYSWIVVSPPQQQHNEEIEESKEEASQDSPDAVTHQYLD